MLVRDAGNLGVLDVLNGVGATGVLGEGVIVVVNDTGGGVEDDVLQDGSEADSTEDVRLLLGGEANGLGVAATLDVEDALVAPAVLIVTDQSALGVSRERGLAGARQAEEDGDVSVLALVGGRVQGEDVVLDGHLEEEDGEDALLHLTSVLCAEDDHFLLGKVDGDGSRRSHACRVAIRREGASVVDDIVGVEVLQLLLGGPDQHVAHEEGMVGAGADNAHADAVALVPAGKAIDDVDAVAGVEVVDGALAVDSPDLEQGLAVWFGNDPT